jgi:hypothetical protein
VLQLGEWLDSTHTCGETKMLLNLNDDESCQNPDESTVISAIEALALDTFAILSRADEDYVQTFHNEDGTYDLEFRAGSYDKHFRATSESLTNEDIAEAFSAYMTGQADWNSEWEWEKVEFDEDFAGELKFDNAYVLNGGEYEKIPLGSEQDPIDLKHKKCPECAVAAGEYHERGCELEECPCCHNPICECDCV